MYNSKYYSAEQVDQRLLQGYYDDVVEKGYNGTKEEFLNTVVDLVNSNILVNNKINPDKLPELTSNNISDFKTAVESILEEHGLINQTEQEPEEP